jgi:hypothetical protein
MVVAHRYSAVPISVSWFQKAAAATICPSARDGELVAVKDVCRDG